MSIPPNKKSPPLSDDRAQDSKKIFSESVEPTSDIPPNSSSWIDINKDRFKRFWRVRFSKAKDLSEGPQPSLKKTPQQYRSDRKRRKREFKIAGIAFVVMIILIFIQLQFFGTTSIVFFALFNFNAILMLGILFVVLRNGMKLILERRKRVFGSKLRTRLVLAITGMTIVPCLIMFLVTAQFVKLSIDVWFKNQVETTIDTSLDVVRSIAENASERLNSQGHFTFAEIQKRGFDWGSEGMDNFLEGKRQEYKLAQIGVLDSRLVERNWHSDKRIGKSWQSAKEQLDWNAVRRHGYAYILSEGGSSDFIFGIIAINQGKDGFLVLSEDMGFGFKSRLDRISEGSKDYKNLRMLKYPLKSMIYITMTVLTALISLSIIWFAIKVARELTQPIMALVSATDRIAKGDLDVRVEDNSSDELSVLVQAFNRMAVELGDNRRELTETNLLLGQQNLVLEQQRNYMETVLNNIAAGVISFDDRWFIATSNKAAKEYLGVDKDEIEGLRITDILPTEYIEPANDIAAKLLKNPSGLVQHQFFITANNVERNILVTVMGLLSSDRELHGAVAVFEDITEMEKMQRSAAWREVAKRIAHEIKNPLTPIKLSAQRLEKKFGTQIDDPVFRQSTQLIVSQVEHLQTMVQEFSTFAKMPEIKPRRGQITPLVEEVMSIFRNGHPAISWFLDVQADIPDIEMDRGALQRVFINLFTNCVSALEGVSKAQVNVLLSYDKLLQFIKVVIYDNGVGFPVEKDLNRIFEPYFSGKKGGTGLGLAIVKNIVNEHHAYIRAENAKNGGALVSIDFPPA